MTTENLAQEMILAELRCRVEPIRAEKLAPHAGVTQRQLRRELLRMSELGIMILSDTRGYWLARNESDAKECMRIARHRKAHAISEMRSARRLEKFARKLGGGQMESIQL